MPGRSPTSGSVTGPEQGSVGGSYGGLIPFPDGPDLFPATITAVVVPDSPPAPPDPPAQYGFREQWQHPETGEWEDRPGGRSSDGATGYALAPAGVSFTTGDVPWMRRHHRHQHLFLIVTGTAATAKLYVRITGGTDPGPYTGVTAVQTAPGVFEDADPVVEIGDIYRRPSNLSTPDIDVGQHVEVWPSPTVPGTYETHAVGAMYQITGAACVVTDVDLTCDPAGLYLLVTRQSLAVTVKSRDLKAVDVGLEDCPDDSGSGG